MNGIRTHNVSGDGHYSKNVHKREFHEFNVPFLFIKWGTFSNYRVIFTLPSPSCYPVNIIHK
jgi:hypothetical protein